MTTWPRGRSKSVGPFEASCRSTVAVLALSPEELRELARELAPLIAAAMPEGKRESLRSNQRC